MKPMAQLTAITKESPLTEPSDQSGCTVNVCCPPWFDRSKTFQVRAASPHASHLTFSGHDLNFAARVLYAEATGSQSGVADTVLEEEKQAILHVMYFRLNRKGYPSNSYVATSFQMVGEAPKVQFESVARNKPKFANTELISSPKLPRSECADLKKCLLAIQTFLATGPDFKKYPFDEFRDRSSRPTWHLIANTAFHLTALGKTYLKEAP